MEKSTAEGSEKGDCNDDTSNASSPFSIAASPSYDWEYSFHVNGERLQEEELVLLKKEAGIWRVTQLKYPEDSDDDELVVITRHDEEYGSRDVRIQDIRKTVVVKEVKPRMIGETR